MVVPGVSADAVPVVVASRAATIRTPTALAPRRGPQPSIMRLVYPSLATETDARRLCGVELTYTVVSTPQVVPAPESRRNIRAAAPASLGKAAEPVLAHRL
jgi:hypothetical protein